MPLYQGTKLMTCTAYHPQTRGYTGRYNKTIVTRLSHYVNEYRDDSDAFVESLI